MNYQGIVDRLRQNEDHFIRVGDSWPGHDGPAVSLYPNLAAELVAREWQITTPSNAAGVSREKMTRVIEDGAELEEERLEAIARRMEITMGYLKAPMLAYVDPTTKKGRRKRAVLKRLLQRSDTFQGIHTFNAQDTLAELKRGQCVTYAAWSWACCSTQWEA
ncbi:hypothetical protein [Vermiculatibacterium agrestimuris]|uniref:hypothetical protein n=1 Tax=Vermiculatibacterium agrestimuris TaxID=2941519 RepID=UPI00203F5980|nr:hypothetical protein [Vermiculatibacterium agrestimuris]